MTQAKTCRVCNTKLDGTNQASGYLNTCKSCYNKHKQQWREANPTKNKEAGTRARRKAGHKPYNKNRACSSFLGVHVAERVLSHVFKDVEKMPFNNPGFDVICNRNRKIDIKSACLSPDKKTMRWGFHIERNTTADYFLCIAFNNRKDLIPQHVWLIPGHKVNHLVGVQIRNATLKKWEAYEIDITKTISCCDTIRNAR